jgi:hypothetical protein
LFFDVGVKAFPHLSASPFFCSYLPLQVSLRLGGTSFVFLHARLPGGDGERKCAARNASLAQLLGGLSARLDARGHRRCDGACHSGDLAAAGCWGRRPAWLPARVGEKGCGGARELEACAAADHGARRLVSVLDVRAHLF